MEPTVQTDRTIITVNWTAQFVIKNNEYEC